MRSSEISEPFHVAYAKGGPLLVEVGRGLVIVEESLSMYKKRSLADNN
jgi:hypothetical protein